MNSLSDLLRGPVAVVLRPATASLSRPGLSGSLIGNTDFSMMEQLDGDDKALKSGGKIARRDIVQFVPFNEFKENPAQLAKEVLGEIPKQLTSYY